MIKRLVIYFFFIALTSVVLVKWQSSRPNQPFPKPANTAISSANTLKTITVDGIGYAYDYFRVSGNQSLQSIYNLDSKRTSADIITAHECTFLSSGGFYGKNGRPIGALTIAGVSLSPHISNQLFNGQLVASPSGGLAIVDQGDTGNWDTVIQTGPILFRFGQARSLGVNNDEPERRIMVITSDDGTARIMIIVSPDSLYSGPTLKSLPAIINTIAGRESFTVTDAINLDGGTASVFKNGQNYIKEMKTVGTFLCFK